MASIHFKGKSTVVNHHLTVPYHHLGALPTKSLLAKGKNPSLHDNMIIHGDNLLALKALLPTHGGKVNCIYIDPPYNTGNEGWRYNDRMNNPMMKDWLGKEVDRDDLTRHEKWLCMMYPRISLLHELLAEDGVIFVSIDDNEQHRLRMMMDEIFGEGNFVGTFIWEGTGKNDAKFISTTQDYIFTYAKNFEMLKINKKRWRLSKQGLDKIYAIVEELKTEYGNDYESISEKLQQWFSSLSKNNLAWQHRHYNMLDEKGVFFPGDISWPGGGGPTYEILHPKTKKSVKIPARGWVFPAKETMLSAIKEGRVHFGKDEKAVPQLKRYLHETDSQVLNSVIYQDRRASHKRLKDIFSKSVFDYPKDERILKRIFEAITGKESIVLDSFAGSGTTAQAVLELNKEDGGNRKFVLVECENYADKITAERVRRVIKGVPKAKKENLKNGLGGHFGYWELGDPIEMESILHGDNMPSYEELARYVFYTATGEQWSSKLMKKRSFLAGESQNYQVYLFYKPDIDYLSKTSLTLELAKSLPKPGKKWRLVFAPARYAHPDELGQRKIKFCQLPFEIYRIKK